MPNCQRLTPQFNLAKFHATTTEASKDRSPPQPRSQAREKTLGLTGGQGLKGDSVVKEPTIDFR